MHFNVDTPPFPLIQVMFRPGGEGELHRCLSRWILCILLFLFARVPDRLEVVGCRYCLTCPDSCDQIGRGDGLVGGDTVLVKVSLRMCVRVRVRLLLVDR